jgi:hypothetical protein
LKRTINQQTTENMLNTTLSNGSMLIKHRNGWEIYIPNETSVVIDMQPQSDDEHGGLAIMQGGIEDHNLTRKQLESVALAMLWMLGKCKIRKA